MTLPSRVVAVVLWSAVVAAAAAPYFRTSRRLGFLKLVAGLLGVGFDELVQREAMRRQRRLGVVAAAALVTAAVFLLENGHELVASEADAVITISDASQADIARLLGGLRGAPRIVLAGEALPPFDLVKLPGTIERSEQGAPAERAGEQAGQRVEVDLVGLGVDEGGDGALDDLLDPAADLARQVVALEHAAALLVDDHALRVHDVVVLEDVLAHDEVLLLHLVELDLEEEPPAAEDPVVLEDLPPHVAGFKTEFFTHYQDPTETRADLDAHTDTPRPTPP